MKGSFKLSKQAAVYTTTTNTCPSLFVLPIAAQLNDWFLQANQASWPFSHCEQKRAPDGPSFPYRTVQVLVYFMRVRYFYVLAHHNIHRSFLDFRQHALKISPTSTEIFESFCRLNELVFCWPAALNAFFFPFLSGEWTMVSRCLGGLAKETCSCCACRWFEFAMVGLSFA